MKKIFIISLGIVFAFIPIFTVMTADAATLNWASDVEAFTQGLQKDGNPVAIVRSDPFEALGPNDAVFVSLGFGGELVLEFPETAGGVLTVDVYEVTGGSYPLESAEVFVSENGIDFTSVGTATNEEGTGDGVTEFLLESYCVKFVKLVDTTDVRLHDDEADGFDVDAVSIEYDEVCENECCECCCSGSDIVFNANDAEVINLVGAEANTGRNYADGSYGGEGGNGGDIEIGDIEEGEVEESATGNGGNGGNASTGGTVITGNATVSATIMNQVNSNNTEIDRCACPDADCCDCCLEENDSEEQYINTGRCDTVVVNLNRARIMNGVGTRANTGNNDVNGSYGGEGGDGGDISIGDEDNHHGGSIKPVDESFNNNHGNNGEGEVEESMTGTGGTGGEGAEGGLVQTGESISWSSVVNMINRNITRIRR